MVSVREMRKRKRVQKCCKVEFCANNVTYRGTSDNFSIDGLFIITDNLVAPDSIISITVYLPDGSVSKGKGVVRQVSKRHDVAGIETSQQTFKGGMGIELIEKDPNYISFFMSLLSNL